MSPVDILAIALSVLTPLVKCCSKVDELFHVFRGSSVIHARCLLANDEARKATSSANLRLL